MKPRKVTNSWDNARHCCGFTVSPPNWQSLTSSHQHEQVGPLRGNKVRRVLSPQEGITDVILSLQEGITDVMAHLSLLALPSPCRTMHHEGLLRHWPSGKALCTISFPVRCVLLQWCKSRYLIKDVGYEYAKNPENATRGKRQEKYRGT